MGYTLDIEVPVNGKAHKSTLTVLGDDGKPCLTDRADLDEARERRRVAKLAAERLGVKPSEVAERLEEEWNRAVAERREGRAARQEVMPPPVEPTPLERTPPAVREEAEAMLLDPNLTDRVGDDIAALGVAGEQQTALTIYLAGTSRLLSRPLSVRVHGPSSSGKSYVAERVAELFPAEAVIHATQMTPQALFHMKPGSLRHRFVVGGERSRVEDDDRAEASRALREMLSSGKLSKLMPVKAPGGVIETVLIEQEGPIAFVETTTLARVFDEDENRCVALHTDERQEQTARIIHKAAGGYAGNGGSEAAAVIARHHALQRLLGALPVVIPYAEKVAARFCTERVEARRAFPHLMSMVQAVALLHQRQRKRDAGAVVAEADDYFVARLLLGQPLIRLLGGSVSDPAMRFFERLVKWAGGEFTTADAKRKDAGSRSAVYGWLAELHDAGFLELIEEARGKKPARWKLAGNPPDAGELAGLPTVEQVFA